MKECKTTQMKANLERLWRTSETHLGEVYNTWSNAKERAYDYCLELVRKYNGYNYRILGANSCVFSFGFIGEINGRKAFFYITHTADRFMYID